MRFQAEMAAPLAKERQAAEHAESTPYHARWQAQEAFLPNDEDRRIDYGPITPSVSRRPTPDPEDAPPSDQPFDRYAQDEEEEDDDVSEDEDDEDEEDADVL